MPRTPRLFIANRTVPVVAPFEVVDSVSSEGMDVELIVPRVSIDAVRATQDTAEAPPFVPAKAIVPNASPLTTVAWSVCVVPLDFTNK